MRKLLLATALALAFWTGRQEYVVTVTGRQAVNCEYQYGGQYFWRVFFYTCPMSVEVE
jgi:hypothetical protein